ncbi:MAG: DsrE family protein [Armatimonadetes bacterium]|nr:DsrE family protein [Armatimonadota bacterium]
MRKCMAMLIQHYTNEPLEVTEALRHLWGASSLDFCTMAVLVDDGVYLAKKNQKNPLHDEFKKIIEAKSNDLRIGADEDSLKKRNINQEEILEGVEVINNLRLGEILSKAHWTMIF